MTTGPAHNLDSTSISRPIVLIGLVAAGKTTVGRLLAARLGLPFLDNDDTLFRRTGSRARDIAERDGLAALHALETDALVAVVEAGPPAVVGAAAGAVLEPAAVAALRRCHVVYLRVAPEVLVLRVQAEVDDGHRPRVDVISQYAERDRGYCEVADLVVDGAAVPAEVVGRIIAALATPQPGASRDG
jgi:shikimate kinase